MVNIQLLSIWRQESNFHRLSPVLFKREHFPNCALIDPTLYHKRPFEEFRDSCFYERSKQNLGSFVCFVATRAFLAFISKEKDTIPCTL